MGTESEIPMAEVSTWLSRAAPDDVRRLLAGCALDDGRSDELHPILDVDAPGKALVLRGGRRVLLRAVEGGMIVDARDGAPLAKAIATLRTPGERRELDDREELRRHHIDADELTSLHDRQVVLDFMRTWMKGALPDWPRRDAFYLSMGRSPILARTGARKLAELAMAFDQAGITADDLPWRQARLLRICHELRDAIKVSDVLFTGRIANLGDRKILATVRAAVLLNLFEENRRREAWALAEAYKAIKVAQGLGADDEEVKSLRRKYDSLAGG